MLSTWLLSSTFFFYFDEICHYFFNVFIVFTIYCVVYLMVFLPIYDLETTEVWVIVHMGKIQMLFDGLGLLYTISLFATIGFGWGWWNSIRDIISVFVIWGPLHFMFHILTNTHYMTPTILVGDAKYRATCRGFFTHYIPMDEQFLFLYQVTYTLVFN